MYKPTKITQIIALMGLIGAASPAMAQEAQQSSKEEVLVTHQPTKEQVTQNVLKHIKKMLYKEVSNLNIHMSWSKDLGMDSLDFIELLLYMEEDYHIKIPDAEAEKMYGLTDLVDCVMRKTR